MCTTERLSSFHLPYSSSSKRNIVSLSAKYELRWLKRGNPDNFEFVLQFLKFDTVCPNIEF